jgi:hypothetical protein
MPWCVKDTLENVDAMTPRDGRARTLASARRARGAMK